MPINYDEIKDLVELDKGVEFNSPQIKTLHNLLTNFDDEVITYLARQSDLDTYEQVMLKLIDIQDTILDLYYDYYPPFRQDVDKLNREYNPNRK